MEKVKEIVSFLRECEFVDMATVTLENTPRCRWMATARVDDDAVMWFATNVESRKIAELRNNPAISISALFAGRVFAGEGKGEIVDDMEMKKELWNDEWTRYFETPENPILTLIKVTFDATSFVSMTD